MKHNKNYVRYEKRNDKRVYERGCNEGGILQIILGQGNICKEGKIIRCILFSDSFNGEKYGKKRRSRSKN